MRTLLAIALVASAACAPPSLGERADGAVSGVPTPLDWPGSSRRSLPQLVEAMNRLGSDVLDRVAEDNENVVLSAPSIAMAFGMARAGAGGQTAAEIDAVMGFSRDAAETAAAFDALNRALVDAAPAPLEGADPDGKRPAGQPSAPPALAIANGVFPDSDVPIEPAYLTSLETRYRADLIPVDFSQPEAAAIVNDWVRRRTRGRIDELAGDIDPATVLVLANAIYLKAEWLLPFAKDPTRPMPFTLADGERITVPTMQQLEQMRYAEGDGWRAVELPYVGERLAMWILVPDEGRAPKSLLEPAVLDAVSADLANTLVELHLPRWDFETSIGLIPVLESLGIHAPFEPGAAEFTGITEEEVWIDAAIHRANITVDEWGTEAAAVTGLFFESSGPPPPQVVVKADHPFAFVILDTKDRIPLFIGQVARPSS